MELGFNFYQFIFTKKEEKDRALANRPWFFENQVLILHQWQPRLTSEDECFSRAPLWIQIGGMPSHWVSKQVGWKIGNLFSQCFNVIIPETDSRKGKF